MKRKRNYELFLKDINDSIEKVLQFTENLSYNEFKNDDKTICAVICKLQIIGEAVKNIPYSFKQKYPRIDWKGMAGLRDKLIHEYFGIDFEILWKIIKEDIPGVRPHLKNILENFNKCVD